MRSRPYGEKIVIDDAASLRCPRAHGGSDGARCKSAGYGGPARLGYRKNQRFSMPRPAYSAEGKSEEHTSELQSLIRISYDVFFLKKKKKKRNKEITDIHSNQNNKHNQNLDIGTCKNNKLNRKI